MVKSTFLIAITALALAGCATGKLEPGPGLKVIDADTLPEPTRADLSSSARPYLIGPFDKLSINVFGVEDLSSKTQTDASGRLSVPLAGEIEAAGRTPTELAAIIADRLRGYVRNPQVTVNLDETVSQVVTVGGEVRKPGLYPVVGRMTLLRAIATAEGTTDLARRNSVVVFRTVSGERYAALYNLRAIEKGTYEDPELFANDVVVVDDSETRRLFRDATGASAALLAPLIALGQR